MKLHRYVDHQRLHIVTKDIISLSISVLLLFRHYISHKITFGAPSSGGVLCSACGAFIRILYSFYISEISERNSKMAYYLFTQHFNVFILDIRDLKIRVCIGKLFSLFLCKTYVVGTR